MKKDCVQTSILIPTKLYEEYKKRKLNLSKFVTDMLEREIAGEFHQLKIDGLKKEIDLLESQKAQIQIKKQEQKVRSDANLQEILDEQLAEREAWREHDRKKPRED